jgi:hypothetical protein
MPVESHTGKNEAGQSLGDIRLLKKKVEREKSRRSSNVTKFVRYVGA